MVEKAILVVIQFNAISMGDPPEDDSIPLHRREWARLQAGPIYWLRRQAPDWRSKSVFL